MPSIRASSPACGVSTAGTSSALRQEAQPVGVDDDGDPVGQCLVHHRTTAGVGPQTRPDDPCLHPAGAGDRLGPPALHRADDLVRADVADHPGSATDGTPARQHGCPRVLSRTSDDAHDAAGVLVGLARWDGKQCTHIRRLQQLNRRLGQIGRQADVDVLDPAGRSRRWVHHQGDLARSERHGCIGDDVLAGQLTRIGVDAAGKVHRDDQPGLFGRELDQQGGVVAQAAGTADPEESVDDQIGGGHRTHRPVRHRPTGATKGSKPALVGPLRPDEDGIHSGPAPRESSPSEQRVTAIVSSADEKRDPSPIWAAQ